jgi:hypothetical protein
LQAIAVRGSREFISAHRQTLARSGEPVHRDEDRHPLLSNGPRNTYLSYTSDRRSGVQPLIIYPVANGSLIQKIAPVGKEAFTLMVPPWASTAHLAMGNPSPKPPESRERASSSR